MNNLLPLTFPSLRDGISPTGREKIFESERKGGDLRHNCLPMKLPNFLSFRTNN